MSRTEKKLFGTDGVRGLSNEPPITVDIALRLGKAAALACRHRKGRHRIVIGKDTRLSGYMLETALASGICSMGVDVLLVGPLPTPGIAFITRSLRADAGIVISASHNPYQDNGIKFFARTGYKLSDRKELEIEDWVLGRRLDRMRVGAEEIGKAARIDDASGRYIEFVKNSFMKGATLDGLRIVLDCANGAAYKVAPAVLRELGADLHVIHNQPNGRNINEGCGSLHPDGLMRAVRDRGADLGIALDGDADRVLLVDETGRVVDGDQILALCAADLLKRGQLPGKTVVATVMSNMGLDKAVAQAGGRVVRSDVGDRCVLERMLREDAWLGGEQSGHVIFREFTTTGDGLVSAFQMLNLLIRERKPLSVLAARMVRFPQVLLNIPVRGKPPLTGVAGLKALVQKSQKELAPYGRVFLRYSGTEPKLRLLVEGENEAVMARVAGRVADLLRRRLGTKG